MRALIALAVVISLGLAALFWWTGGDRVILAWAVEGQRAAQGGMGRALGALRTGDAAAVVPLLGVCFLYGFFHAAGPGHGKLLIGGYGAARAVGAWRLSTVAVASSLAQGVTAILLVGAGVWLLDWSRDYMTDLAERLLQPLGFAAIALIGLWLVVRGLRQMRHRARGWPMARTASQHPSTWVTIRTVITITTITITTTITTTAIAAMPMRPRPSRLRRPPPTGSFWRWSGRWRSGPAPGRSFC
jgi:ABC-type nickel/cobalt efflux system permease component RcnA